MTRCALTIISIIAVLAVLGYNFWAYCCGRCAVENFVDLGPFGLFLTGVTLIAGTALLVLKACRIRKLRRSRCSCGALPAIVWSFCPRCGSSLKASRDVCPAS